MFGFRSDGKKVKNMNIIDKAEPFFMPQRIDAVNYTTVKVKCDTIDEFIARERKNGISYNYMHIVIAAIVRILYIRKKLNRFIMRGSIYQRNTISVSMDIKKKLEDEGEQVTLKMFFTGRESLEEVKKIMNTKPGFIKAMWCGDPECELKMKEIRGMKSRCIPFEEEHISDHCIVCGKKAKHMVYWGIQY